MQIIGEDMNAARELVESAADTGPDPERRARATELLDRVDGRRSKSCPSITVW